MSSIDDEKLDLSNYTYVFASTLNQMVNYIPIKFFGFTDMYNVTLFKDLTKNGDDGKVEENKKWDDNLASVLKVKPQDIKILQKNYLKISETITKFDEKLKDKKVVWNITGGQRPFLLAVLEFTKNRHEDYIMYLEGNIGEMSITKANEFSNQKDEVCFPYKLSDDVTLETALKLMDVKPQSNLADSKDLNEDENSFWINVHSDYCKNEELRKNFVMLNKKNDENGRHLTEKDKNSFWDTIYTTLKISKDCPMKAIREDSKNEYPFGYILEKMAFYVLYNKFSHQVQQIYSSVRTYNVGKQIDEFDIIILTKQGQIINFECKSGMMDSDVAKSTKYSTYAIAGVYGLPILITPLLGNELEKEPKFPFNKSYDAKNAAKRANLQVLGIDEIDKIDIIK
jgi:hypothetical protein